PVQTNDQTGLEYDTETLHKAAPGWTTNLYYTIRTWLTWTSQMTSETQTGRRILGNFNGDFDELAALMNRSWGENQEQPLHYTREFLQSSLEYPGCTMELVPAIYRE